MTEIIEPKFKIEINGLKFLGRGPKSSCTEDGWSRSKNIIYKCVECGSEMSASHNDYWNCKCRAVHLDVHAGRFGSKYGDQNILVYSKETNLSNQNLETKSALIEFIKKFFPSSNH